MARSPYQVLGISESATPDEIKKAYRKKARENHPDLNPNDPAAAERMNEVNEAYDRLMNPQKYESKDRAARSAQGYSNARGSSGYGSSGFGSSGYGSTGSSGYGASGQTGRGGSGQAGYGSAGQGGYQGAGYRGAGASGGSSAQGGSQQGYAGPYGWSSDFGFNFEDLFGMGFGAAASAPASPEVSVNDSAEVRQAISYINSDQHAQAVSILNSIPSYGRDARWHYLIALANYGAGNEMLALDQIRRACEMDSGNVLYQQAMRSMRQPSTSYQQQAEQRGFSVGFIDPCTICCGCLALQTCCYPMMFCRVF